MLIAGNWKMYKTASETAEFQRRMLSDLGKKESTSISIETVPCGVAVGPTRSRPLVLNQSRGIPEPIISSSSGSTIGTTRSRALSHSKIST